MWLETNKEKNFKSWDKDNAFLFDLKFLSLENVATGFYYMTMLIVVD